MRACVPHFKMQGLQNEVYHVNIQKNLQGIKSVDNWLPSITRFNSLLPFFGFLWYFLPTKFGRRGSIALQIFLAKPPNVIAVILKTSFPHSIIRTNIIIIIKIMHVFIQGKNMFKCYS